MANVNQFSSTVEALFKGMNQFIASKTVVGDPVKVGDTTIIPLIDVTFGMGAGAGNAEARKKGSGGVGGKIIPSAVLVVRGENVRLINVKNEDMLLKLLDMVPDLMDRAQAIIKGKKKSANEEEFTPDVEEAIKRTVEDNTETF